MGIGFKPRGETGPLYHPERDYAYITPTLMRSAIEKLDCNDISEEATRWKAEHNITSAELGAAAEVLARAQRDFISAADPVTSLEQALSRRDYYDIRYSVRQFLFATIGYVVCAAWFKAVRDVTVIGEPSAADTAMIDFAASAHKFATNAALERTSPILETLQARNDLLSCRCNILGQECSKLRQELAEIREQEAARKVKAPKSTTNIAISAFIGYLARTCGLSSRN